MFLPSLSYRQVSGSPTLKAPADTRAKVESGSAGAVPLHFAGVNDKFHSMAAHAAHPGYGTVCPQRDLFNSVLQDISEIEAETGAEIKKTDFWKPYTPPPVLEASPAGEEPKKHKHVTYTKGEKRSILAEIRKLVLLPGIDTDQQALAEMKNNNPDRQLPTVGSLKIWRNEGIGR